MHPKFRLSILVLWQGRLSWKYRTFCIVTHTSPLSTLDYKFKNIVADHKALTKLITGLPNHFWKSFNREVQRSVLLLLWRACFPNLVLILVFALIKLTMGFILKTLSTEDIMLICLQKTIPRALDLISFVCSVVPPYWVILPMKKNHAGLTFKAFTP